jgi:alpha-1,2-mannosyltransferase
MTTPPPPPRAGHARARFLTRLDCWQPSRAAVVVICLVFAASATMQVTGVPFTPGFGTRTLFDLDVYRLGSILWRQHQSLYAEGSMPFTADGIWLPFTYPPFAAMMFVPLGLMSLTAAGVVVTVTSCLLTVTILAVTLHVLGVGTPAGRWWGATALAAVVIWTNPFWMTLGFGQINVILMAMVVADVFLLGAATSRPDSPWRGVLVGLAAAIKLTPAVFGLVFTAQRRWRAAVVCAGAFVAAGAIAWLWLPGDSVDYWTDTLLNTSRIGDLTEGINQNLNALWFRILGDTSAQSVCWLASVVAVTVLLALAVRANLPGRGNTATDRELLLSVTLAVAVWGLLVSPTSWGHHWTWGVVATLVAAILALRADDGLRFGAYGLLAIVGAVVFAIGPYQLLPTDTAYWSPVEQVIGNAYILWGVAFLVVVWLLPCRRTPAPDADD